MQPSYSVEIVIGYELIRVKLDLGGTNQNF
jgi:hypothetical protein